MNRLRLAHPLAFLCLVAVLGGAGGATAASLVTGAQIQDGTVSGVDIRDGTLTGVDVGVGRLDGSDVRDRSLGARDFDSSTKERLRGSSGITGYELVEATAAVPAGASGIAVATCPPGKEAISVQGFFRVSDVGVQTRLIVDGGIVHGHNDLAVPQDITVQIVCGRLRHAVEVERPAPRPSDQTPTQRRESP